MTPENLGKISENLCKAPENPLKNPLKTLPLGDPLRGRFPSQRLSVLLPLFHLPLELSPRWSSFFLLGSYGRVRLRNAKPSLERFFRSSLTWFSCSSECEVHAGPTCGNKTPILKTPKKSKVPRKLASVDTKFHKTIVFPTSTNMAAEHTKIANRHCSDFQEPLSNLP